MNPTDVEPANMQSTAQHPAATSGEVYRLLAENSLDLIGLLGLDGTIEYASPSHLRLLGSRPEQLVGTSVFGVIHPEDQDRTLAAVRAALETLESRTVELRLVSKDDTPVHVEAVVTPIADGGDGRGRLLLSVRDATARHRAQAALRDSEERLRGIIDSALDAVVTMDTQGRIIEWNPQAEAIFGWRRAEVTGRTMFDTIVPPRHREERLRSLLRFFRTGESELLGRRVELTGMRKDGSEFPAEVAISISHVGEYHLFSAFIHDLTEHRRTGERLRQIEEQLRQAQKMEAIGRLAAGVAHDFNNLLTVITASSELLLGSLGALDPRRRDVEEVTAAAGRAAGLTRQLLAFSRKQVLAPVELDLNSVVATMEKLLRRLVGEDVTVATAPEADLGRVLADPGQMEQVIMNLAVNARDAMPTGGKITIETRNVDLDSEYSARHVGVTPGRYVMLGVSDSGTGMDAETRTRIFEPFYTTKPAGKGTGLGLSTVHGIVKQSGGDIWVYSELGIGTTFRIYLPRVEASAQPSPAQAARPDAPASGSETILIVEDEDALRRAAREILKRSGYTVLEARNGLEALALVERNQAPIHLVLTDVVMPELSGRELGERLAVVSPNTRILYMSGYTEDAIVHTGILEAQVKLLEKPFTLQGLTLKVREVLDAA